MFCFFFVVSLRRLLIVVIVQLRHQLLVFLTLVADGLESVSVLVLINGKLAKATAQILVFFCQHFDLLLDLVVNGRRKKKMAIDDNGI